MLGLLSLQLEIGFFGRELEGQVLRQLVFRRPRIGKHECLFGLLLKLIV